MNLKKIISLLALSALLGTGVASAQEKFEINGGFGFAPLTIGKRVETFANTSGTLGAIYAPMEYDVKVSGSYGIEGSYKVGSRLYASLLFSYSRLMSIEESHSKAVLEDVTGSCIAVIQRWKYEWIQNPSMRLYSSAGFGIGNYSNFKTDGVTRYGSSDVEFQFVPVGVAVGKDWFWFVEAGVGTQYTGGRAGVGFRF